MPCEVSHGRREVVTKFRPPAAPKPLPRRKLKRIIGLTTAAGMTAALTVPSAFAAPTDDSEAQAHLINLDLSALGLELDVLDAITTDSGYPSDEGANTANIDIGVLNALGISIPGIDLPLIGDGTNNGLLDLGEAAAAGVLNGYAASPSAIESLAASGALGADGAIDVDAGSSTDPARVDLTGLLGQVNVDDLTNEIIDELSLELGALASRAEANAGDIERDYLLAGAELVVSSPSVAGLSSQLADAYSQTAMTIESTVNGLIGPDGDITQALGEIELDASIPLVATANLEGIEASLDITLPPVNDVLTNTISSSDTAIQIDLTTGEIIINLAKIVKDEDADDLNGLSRNTEILDTYVVEAIVEGVGNSLAQLVDSINEAVLDSLHGSELTVAAGVEVSAL